MSKRRIALVIVSALVALGAVTVQSSASGGATNCGGGVRAVVVDCPKAKLIAKEYAKTRRSAIQGYTCSAHRRGDTFKARCVLDNKAVLFTF